MLPFAPAPLDGVWIIFFFRSVLRDVSGSDELFDRSEEDDLIDDDDTDDPSTAGREVDTVVAVFSRLELDVEDDGVQYSVPGDTVD